MGFKMNERKFLLINAYNETICIRCNNQNINNCKKYSCRIPALTQPLYRAHTGLNSAYGDQFCI